jgi:ADP-ribosyl-[dinitrogen reductase] hydrolase
MLGTIIGDIAGSAYEFANYRAKDFQPFFNQKARFTDDTVCTIAIADALLTGRDPAVTLRDWCRRYYDNGGWGQRFALWIGDDDMGPYNSLGNGGAMRVSSAGLLAESVDEAITLANHVTAITHNHPEGMRGAAATAVAIHLAKTGASSGDIRQAIGQRFGYDLSSSVDEIRPGYRHSEKSQDTVPQALICALDAVNFEDAIRNAISIGGDSDTIAAIAGGVAEAMFGIDEGIAAQAWGYLPQDMRSVLSSLYEAAQA